MRLGEKLYKEYEAYHFAHLLECTEEAEYARFIQGLPHGFSCYKAFQFDDVYDILEKAHKEGKKVRLVNVPPEDQIYKLDNGIEITIPSHYDPDEADDDAYLQLAIE